jgi:hypothetical protein
VTDRRLAAYPMMVVAAVAAQGLVAVADPGPSGRLALLGVVCAAAVGGVLVWSEQLALRPGLLRSPDGAFAQIASLRSHPNARLWLPAAIGPTALTLEIALLLYVASRVGSNGVAMTGLALALAIIMVVDAGPLALAETAGEIISERLRPALSWYTLIVGGIACALLVPVWSGLLGNPLAFDADRWDATRHALIGLSVTPLFVALRRRFHGYMVSAGRTVWTAAVARVLTSVAVASVLALALDWGTIGIGLGLTVGVLVEVGVFALGPRGREVVHLTRAHSAELREVAVVHLPYSRSTLVSVAPAAAVLVALAVSDGTDRTLLAWLVVFGGPWLIGSVLLHASPLIAAGRHTSAKELVGIGVVLGAVPAVLWLVLGIHAGIDPKAVGWLALFPILTAIRGLLHADLAAQTNEAPERRAVVAGSVLTVLTFAVAATAGLEPVAAAALAVTAGAAVETPLLALSWRRLVR